MQTEQLYLDDGLRWRSRSPALARADLVLYFGSTERVRDGGIGSALRRRYPGAIVAGFSCAALTPHGPVNDDSAMALAIRCATLRASGGLVTIRHVDASAHCGRVLGVALNADDLAAVFVVSEALLADPRRLVDGLASVLPDAVALCGALAVVDAQSPRTLMALDGTPQADRVVAIGLHRLPGQSGVDELAALTALLSGTATSVGFFPFGESSPSHRNGRGDPMKSPATIAAIVEARL